MVLTVSVGIVSWFVYTQILNHALCLAASQEDTAAVERLLKLGANPNAVGIVPAPNCGSDSDSLNALSLAVDNTAIGCGEQVGPLPPTDREVPVNTATVLLAAGANINVRNNDGYTPLKLAHTPHMVKFLLAHGAK